MNQIEAAAKAAEGTLFQIKNGPHKMELSFALFQKPQSGVHTHPLIFTLADDRKLEVQILGVSVEDGSHESWITTGYVKDVSRCHIAIIDQPDGSEKLWDGTYSEPIEFYYETKGNTGTITLPLRKG